VRHSLTFVVTLFADEAEPEILRGRLRAIQRDSDHTFASAAELLGCLLAEIEAVLAEAGPSAAALPGSHPLAEGSGADVAGTIVPPPERGP